MIKTITKVGNSRGIIFDSALLQLARLKEGDEVNVEVHSSGTITITPTNGQTKWSDVESTIEEVMDEYSDTLKKLAK